MSRFNDFHDAYHSALDVIHKFMAPGQYEPQMDGLVKWMLETDTNPYSYLPEIWGSALGTAEGFASLLQVISHALYDDGEITFVKVNGSPRIVFAWANETNFRDYVLSNQEKELEKKSIRGYGNPYEIEVLKITPNEFGPLCDEYNRAHLKYHFFNDAEDHGIDWAADHYRKYKLWQEEWVEECRTQLNISS